VKGDGYVCAAASADITTIAKATAKAFAQAYAEAISCDCHVDVEATAKAIGSVFVKAAASAYKKVCSCAHFPSSSIHAIFGFVFAH
jgi:hypothetical protein